MRRRYQQVDVFSTKPFSGNPLAVVLDGEDMTADEMQRFARWTNLSETTFVLPPTRADADYRVRIFTLAGELPFAGHPTLGTCQAWLNAGGVPRDSGLIVQECGAGLVSVRRDRQGLAFAAPRLLRSGPVDEAFVDQIASVLGVERRRIVASQWVDNGPGWVGVILEDAASVLSLQPDFARHTGRGSLDIGVIGAYPSGSECAFEVRAFFSDERGGMIEDPVTGSLNASLAQWLLSSGRAEAPYVVSQGTKLGRSGRVRIEETDDGVVWIGGAVTACISGTVEI